MGEKTRACGRYPKGVRKRGLIEGKKEEFDQFINTPVG